MNLADFGLVPHHSKTVSPGDRFGRLTVRAIGKPPGSYRYAAVCDCDCGTTNKVVRLDGLARGAVTGCGCVQAEASRVHGLAKHPLYKVWGHMRARCLDPDDKNYPNYGGRGIRICERWASVEAFVADMGPTYAAGLELDREDNDGDYTPDNCRWVTHAENSDNRRTGRKLTFEGRTQSLRRWAEETGISEGTLWERVTVWGWEVGRALTTPPLSATERMAIARAARWSK